MRRTLNEIFTFTNLRSTRNVRADMNITVFENNLRTMISFVTILTNDPFT